MGMLSVGKQPGQTPNIFRVNRKLVRILACNLGGFFPTEVATHALSPHQLTCAGNVDAGLGAFMGFKFWHRLNLRPVVRPAQDQGPPRFFVLPRFSVL